MTIAEMKNGQRALALALLDTVERGVEFLEASRRIAERCPGGKRRERNQERNQERSGDSAPPLKTDAILAKALICRPENPMANRTATRATTATRNGL